MRRFFRFIFVCLAIFFVGHTVYAVIDGLRDTGGNADIAVVLGNKVNKDGTLSPRLEKRLEKALELYRDGRVKMLFVSGGLGNEGHYEGKKMRDYLVANGVPVGHIIVDNKGDSTEATVENLLAMRESLGFNSAISVSQYYHQARIKLIFRRSGFSAIDSASPLYFEVRDLYSITREFAGYYCYLLLG